MKIHELLEARYDLKTGKAIGGDDTLSHTLEKAGDIAAAIESNCGDMLAGYRGAKGKVLWRGIGKARWRDGGDSHIIAQLATIRQDRKPVEVTLKQHNRLDKAFKELGLTATRKNGIFCSSSLKVASEWGGAPYAIFLKDGWSGTVFQNSKETYAFYSLAYAGQDEDTEEDKMSAIHDALADLEPIKIESSNDLTVVLLEGYTDIIMTGDSYIALQEEEELTTAVGKLLGLKL